MKFLFEISRNTNNRASIPNNSFNYVAVKTTRIKANKNTKRDKRAKAATSDVQSVPKCR